MAKKNVPINVNYKISNIQELELIMPGIPESVADDFDEGKLDFGFTFDYIWDIKDETFAVVVEVVYAYDREVLNEILLKFVGLVEYKIENLKQFLDMGSKEVQLPEEFLAILTGIAISTMRGMIALRTIGKFQGDFYIPILNPGDVVRDYLSRAEKEN